MRFFYADPSALGKAYAVELGTPIMQSLLTQVMSAQEPRRLLLSRIGLGEVIASVHRKRNAGTITPTLYREALSRIHADAVLWRLITVGDPVVDQSIALVLTHNINASDAIHLQTALMVRGAIQTAGHDFVFVCSDKRLLRAAQAEGFQTLNPETASASDVTALLN